MGRPSRFSIAKADIISFFEDNDVNVYSRRDIGWVLNHQRQFWRLTKSMTVDSFIDELIKKTSFEEVELKFDDVMSKRYIFQEASPFEIALSLKPKAYLSHYSAFYFHELTNQIPKTIYISHELGDRGKHETVQLKQANIDRAFAKPQRKSKMIAEYGDYNICVLSAKNTGMTGIDTILESNNVQTRLTSLERTLIDAVVRPLYCGGVEEVLRAFEIAKTRVSINKMMGILKEMDFIYPYHQAIGFYLERAGYRQAQLDLVKRIPMENDFYLTYEMKTPEYSESWRLYYPKGF